MLLCFQARNKQNGELAAIKVIKMEPGESLTSFDFVRKQKNSWVIQTFLLASV